MPIKDVSRHKLVKDPHSASDIELFRLRISQWSVYTGDLAARIENALECEIEVICTVIYGATTFRAIAFRGPNVIKLFLSVNYGFS